MEQIVGSIVTVNSIIVRLSKPLDYMDLVPAIPLLLVDAMVEKLAILPTEQDVATNIVDVGPRCLPPVGATCTDIAECLTDACASIDGSGTNKEGVCSSTN
jgi:hypothetical protein